MFPELKDFYNEFDDLAVSEEDKKKFPKFLKGLTPEQRRMIGLKTNFYIVDFENKGGLVMPIIIELTHKDETTREIRLPAEIWVQNATRTSRLIMSKKPVTSIKLDPHLETADVDMSNNVYPPTISKSRFKLYKDSKSKNQMQKSGLGRKADEKSEAKPKKATSEKAPKESADKEAPAKKKPAKPLAAGV